jgi:hypothetical protein
MVIAMEATPPCLKRVNVKEKVARPKAGIEDNAFKRVLTSRFLEREIIIGSWGEEDCSPATSVVVVGFEKRPLDLCRSLPLGIAPLPLGFDHHRRSSTVKTCQRCVNVQSNRGGT